MRGISKCDLFSLLYKSHPSLARHESHASKKAKNAKFRLSLHWKLAEQRDVKQFNNVAKQNVKSNPKETFESFTKSHQHSYQLVEQIS